MIRGRNSVSRAFAVLAALSIVGFAGCGQKSSGRSVDEVLKQSGSSRTEVLPLAGTITIDGQVPEAGGFGKPRLVVMLFDQAKLDAPPSSVPKVQCDARGDFAFSTYDQGDGVAPGKYVLALVELKFDKRKGYFGVDVLKNLYNDPEQNLKVADLTIDHHAAKKDYAIDLKIAGRDAVTPGPKAVTKLK